MWAQSLLGLFVFCAAAWLMSENRRSVRVKTIVMGLSVQLIIGAILLKIPLFRNLFLQINRIIFFLEESTTAGSSFVFGYLGGAPLPFEEKIPGAGFILAFRALPLILVVSALSSLLFYWKILPRIVRGFSWCLEKTLGIGGAEGLGISANVFVGMVEAPLLIRPYLDRMTRSEIFSLMTCGMATIAGTVMVLYAGILSGTIPGAMGHILVASIISAPAAITFAKIMVPETESPTTGSGIEIPEESRSAMDAVTRGTFQGAALLINIIAMLVVLVALVHLADLLLSLFPEAGGSPVTLQRILGIAMAPVVWLMGVPVGEIGTAGALMGTKTILNELIAYLDMSRLPPGELSPRSMLILTYAMCGFANPGSLGIMIGGLGTIAPGRRDEIVSLGFRSLVAGTLATCMTGAVVGVLGG